MAIARADSTTSAARATSLDSARGNVRCVRPIGACRIMLARRQHQDLEPAHPEQMQTDSPYQIRDDRARGKRKKRRKRTTRTRNELARLRYANPKDFRRKRPKSIRLGPILTEVKIGMTTGHTCQRQQSETHAIVCS